MDLATPKIKNTSGRCVLYGGKKTMNIHEKVNLQYKFMEAANNKIEDNDSVANELEYLIQSYQEGHEVLSSMDIVNEMISIIEYMYKKEVEISMLHKAVKVIGEEV